MRLVVIVPVAGNAISALLVGHDEISGDAAQIVASAGTGESNRPDATGVRQKQK